LVEAGRQFGRDNKTLSRQPLLLACTPNLLDFRKKGCVDLYIVCRLKLLEVTLFVKHKKTIIGLFAAGPLESTMYG
jgi:hypothetical protein